MRAVWDDRPDDADATYSPRALPGMEEAATPIQGLLWADVGSNGKRPAPKPQQQDNGPTPLFDAP
jgi:hypothetical protein